MALTEDDLQASIDRVERVLRESGAAELAELVRRLTKTSPRATRRAPLGVISEGSSVRRMPLSVPLDEPQQAGRPTHLILDPDSARAYDLFSVEHVGKNGNLAEVLAWRGAHKFFPGTRLSLTFQRNEQGLTDLPVPIRGLLWCEVEEP